MNLLKYFVLIAGGALLHSGLWAQGDAALVLTEGTLTYNLGPQMEVLEDPRGDYTISEVSSPEFQSRFRLSGQDVPNYGLTNSVYWLKIRIKNPRPLVFERHLELSFANFHSAELYISDEIGRYRFKKGGISLPFEFRDFFRPKIIWKLEFAGNTVSEIYFRFQNEASMTLPLSLWVPKEHERVSHSGLLIQGLFFGGLAIMICYNILLGFNLRQARFTYYIFFVISFTLLFFSYEGLAYQYIWPGWPRWNQKSIPLFFGLSGVFGLLFTVTFLELKTRLPRLYRIMAALALGMFCLVLATPLFSYALVVKAMSRLYVVLCIMMAVAGVISRRSGYRPAGQFISAWLAMLSMMFVTLLVRLGFLPSNVLTEQSYRIGFLFFVVLLARALGDRIKLLRREIENRKLVEKELIKAMDRAESASLAKSEFLSNMSHEIRTPMNSIMGMSELLNSSGLNEEQKKYMEVLGGSGESLLTLIDNVLDISKIEAGQIELELIPFSPGQLVESAILIMKSEAKKKGIELSIQVDDKTPDALLGDPTRIKQVLLNLLSNAVKFTDDGRITVEITRLEHKGPNHRLAFNVQDTGVGISVENRQKIFDAFTQEDSSITRNYGGTGLGLAISKRLIELMGGHISVESEPGHGSSFCFELDFPLASRDAPEAKGQGQEKSILAITPVDSKLILLVEDNEDNVFLIQNFLKGSGHQLDIASNGEEALGRFKKYNYDLVLMDIQMPVMDGHSATREIRKWEDEEGRKRTPVIALTAHALVTEIRKSRAAGCDDHITKPIRKNELLRLIVDYGASKN